MGMGGGGVGGGGGGTKKLSTFIVDLDAAI